MLFAQLDPAGIITSVPGVGEISGAQILARLGDPTRFRSLAGARSFSGLVPALDASGQSGKHGGPTKAGDALLREALFIAADHARRVDPSLAAKYHRLLVETGKHHNSALCHIATTLLSRHIACWRAGQRYALRDPHGHDITAAQGRAIVTRRYPIPTEIRRRTTTVTRATRGTSRRNKESPSAPSTGPSTPHATTTTRT